MADAIAWVGLAAVALGLWAAVAYGSGLFLAGRARGAEGRPAVPE